MRDSAATFLQPARPASATAGLAELGASTLVIVADPGYPAIRIYRSVGFADREAQVGLQRPPAVPGE